MCPFVGDVAIGAALLVVVACRTTGTVAELVMRARGGVEVSITTSARGRMASRTDVVTRVSKGRIVDGTKAARARSGSSPPSTSATARDHASPGTSDAHTRTPTSDTATTHDREFIVCELIYVASRDSRHQYLQRITYK